MLTNQELTTLLRNNGYKVTPQRLAVYEALAEKHWHPNAEMLYRKLQPKYPAMSFATVYKTVEILQDIKAIQILNTGEDSYRYDANMHEHCHLCCTQCGHIEDVMINAPMREQLTKLLHDKCGYTISGGQFYFYGLCPNCQKLH